MAFAPAAEENRAYAGVGNSAQQTTAFSSPTWGSRLKNLLKQLWGDLKALAWAALLFAYNNLFALIALPAFFFFCMWLVTTCIDAPRRAAWMRALAAGRPQPSFSFLGCGLCGTRMGWYPQQRPITHAVEPCFTEKDIPNSVPARGPPSALSPMPEPFMYVRMYDTLMALVARATGYTQWAPPPRPTQGALFERRVKQMQKFRFTDLAAHQAVEEAEQEQEAAVSADFANPLNSRREVSAAAESSRRLGEAPAQASHAF